jgi:bifunctional non-homologous end joining protein LigD
MATEAYKAKRDFTQTPEPPDRKRPREEGGHNFVVHRHEARNLHYDLRIQADGEIGRAHV